MYRYLLSFALSMLVSACAHTAPRPEADPMTWEIHAVHRYPQPDPAGNEWKIELGVIEAGLWGASDPISGHEMIALMHEFQAVYAEELIGKKWRSRDNDPRHFKEEMARTVKRARDRLASGHKADFVANKSAPKEPQALLNRIVAAQQQAAQPCNTAWTAEVAKQFAEGNQNQEFDLQPWTEQHTAQDADRVNVEIFRDRCQFLARAHRSGYTWRVMVAKQSTDWYRTRVLWIPPTVQ